MADAEVEGVRYKVVWSCLLLVEMIMTDMACAAHFKALATNLVGKVAELLRLFNSRSTQLVLGAGSIHSAARLKSINAKHLSLVTQCVGLIISILPHVRAALMAQLPAKQHTLLNDLDTIKREYEEHNEKILNKFVNIIGGIVEHGLAPRIGNTNFDARAMEELPDGTIACCVFLEGISTNTRKMHQVLSSLLPTDHLQDSFSRIFAYLDQKLPELFIAATVGNPPSKPPMFSFPLTDEGKRRMLLEVETTTKNLNALPGVRPWDFSAVSVLEQEMDYKLIATALSSQCNGPATESPAEDESNENAQSSASPVVNAECDSTRATEEKPNEESEASQSPEADVVENDATPGSGASEPLLSSNQDDEASANANGTAENENGDSGHHNAAPLVGSNGSSNKTPTDVEDTTAKPANDEAGDPVSSESAGNSIDSINGDVPS